METGKTDFFQIKIVVDETIAKIAEEVPTPEGVGIPTSDNHRNVGKNDEYSFSDGDERVRFNGEHHIMLDDAKK